MANIYVASSWRNQHQPQVVIFLREQGHEVYDFRHPAGKTGFQWSQIDEDWENWSIDQYRAALEHPIAQAGFKSDFDAMQWADVCVLVLPCGRSAHSEAGWMKGAGKKVIVYQIWEEEPELMYKLFDGVCSMGVGLQMFLAEFDKKKITYNNKENIMEPLVRLEGCKGVRGILHAYMSCDADNVRKALELGIACTGANDTGAYNIYFDDERNICCEYMQRCVTKIFKRVDSIREAVDWMDEVMNK